jgi:carboxylesterase
MPRVISINGNYLMDIVTESNFIEDGKKRTGILLIHGLTGSPTEMKPLEKYLKKLGFDVENILLAGHGGTHAEMIGANSMQWLASAREGMQRILSRNDRVIACGLSMGSIIASCLAAEESRVSALVMLSPTLDYDGGVALSTGINKIFQTGLARKFARTVLTAFPLLSKHLYWEESPPYGISDVRIQRQITKSIEDARNGGGNEFGVFRTYYKSFMDMWQLIDYGQECFPKVKCPVLLMHSLEDTLASVHNATESYLSLGSSNKALFMLTGCDHVMTLDLQRQLVQKLIGAFAQQYSSVNTEFKTVRSVIAPVLSQAKIAKGGALSAIISPEMHGLDKEEWKVLYPGRRYAHLASVSDVNQLHSLVLRDMAQPLMSLPVFIGDYGQDTLRNSSIASRTLSRLLAPNASLIYELPGLGLNKAAAEDSKAKALSYLSTLVDSMARSAKADAFTNVQHETPSLPQAAELTRSADNKQIHINRDVLRLLSGAETFCHRNKLAAMFSRFIRVAVPAPQAEREMQRLENATAVSVG